MAHALPSAMFMFMPLGEHCKAGAHEHGTSPCIGPGTAAAGYACIVPAGMFMFMLPLAVFMCMPGSTAYMPCALLLPG